jgi:hypothetical protein
MVRRRNAERWLEECLGKKAAEALLRKMERMAKKGATAAEIEKAIVKDFSTRMRARLDNIFPIGYTVGGPRRPHT